MVTRREKEEHIDRHSDRNIYRNASRDRDIASDRGRDTETYSAMVSDAEG